LVPLVPPITLKDHQIPTPAIFGVMVLRVLRQLFNHNGGKHEKT